MNVIFRHDGERSVLVQMTVNRDGTVDAYVIDDRKMIDMDRFKDSPALNPIIAGDHKVCANRGMIFDDVCGKTCLHFQLDPCEALYGVVVLRKLMTAPLCRLDERRASMESSA
jgi:hypothetical protein